MNVCWIYRMPQAWRWTAVALVAATAHGAELDGTYELRGQIPGSTWSVEAAKSVPGPPIEIIERYQFLSDHSFRRWYLMDGQILQGAPSSAWSGAWLMEEDRLYFLAGAGVGMRMVRVDGDGFELSMGAGGGLPMILRDLEVHIGRISGPDAEFPYESLPSDEAYAELQEIVEESRDLADFVGADSREELLQAAGLALATKDYRTLLRLQYPVLKPYYPGERLNAYLSYVSKIGLREIRAIVPNPSGDNSMDYETTLELSQANGIGFPAPAEPKGFIQIAYETGSSSKTYIFYGTVEDRWAILGDMVMLDELPERLGEQ